MAKIVALNNIRSRNELESIEADIAKVRGFMEENGFDALRIMTVSNSILAHQKDELLKAMGKETGECDCLPCQMKRHIGVS